MVQLYLRYQPSATFGVIVSPTGNVLYDRDGQVAIVPSLESITCWNVRTGEKIATWQDEDNKSEVTCLCRSPNGTLYAAGYGDGSIRLWNIDLGMSTVTFTGHRSAVTALAFDSRGERLCSGAKDTDIVCWDIVAERGLFRLRGHKDQITGIKFLDRSPCDHIVSASKDSMLRFWDLSTQHCVETIIAHRGEVWGLDVLPVVTGESDMAYTLVTGGADGDVRVWKLDATTLSKKLETVAGGVDNSWTSNADDSAMSRDGSGQLIGRRAVVQMGLLERQSKERIVTICFHSSGRFLGVQGTDRLVEIYKVRSEGEVRRRVARLKRRQKEKHVPEDAMDDDETHVNISDLIPRVAIIRCSAKIRSFDLTPSLRSHSSQSSKRDDVPSGIFQVLCSLNNNQLEIHSAGQDSQDEPTKQERIIETAGHRTDIRTICLSSDDSSLLSGSSDAVKIWNLETGQCRCTIETGYALCSSFVPGNNHAIIGTKSGELQILDLLSSTILESIKAHDGPIWSLQVWPDRRGITTGSADKDVKFFEFALVEDADNGGPQLRRLTLTHIRTLRLSDDVLCVRHSHDGRLLAVSLLDCTVKVFYADTLKFFLSLYGHKLPVLAMDISSDGTLIATASADKSLKIWGLDFGDCHRSLLAHQDSVMACQFVFGTHYVFTAGKDKIVKFWDADKFEQVLKLEGHHGEIWALAIGKYGSVVVSASHDKSIRLWKKTDEQFTVEEEREKEIEELYEKAGLDDSDERNAVIGSGADVDGTTSHVAVNDASNEVGAAGRRTAETLKAGERVMAAIELWEEESDMLGIYEREIERWKAQGSVAGQKPKAPQRSPFVIAARQENEVPESYVLHVIEGIRLGDLEQALLVLSFPQVLLLLKILAVWVDRSHHHQLVATRSCKPILLHISSVGSKLLRFERDSVGYNLAGLHLMKREWDAEHSQEFIEATHSVVPPASTEKDGSGDEGRKWKRKGEKRKRFIVKSN